MTLTYAELLEGAIPNRQAFGRMLLNWRRRNGWTQYTACTWAKEAGFDAISYGNLSVIEQGKAGELRQKAFWQLADLNCRIAERNWGPVKSQEIKAKLENAIPIGDEDCPVWTPLELWACYCGLRPVPPAYQADVPPSASMAKAKELTRKWRDQLRGVVARYGLEPFDVFSDLTALAGVHGKRFHSVLAGFDHFRPEELSELWDAKAQTYRPQMWLDTWERTCSA